jgi:hypothetical protein
MDGRWGNNGLRIIKTIIVGSLKLESCFQHSAIFGGRYTLMDITGVAQLLRMSTRFLG